MTPGGRIQAAIDILETILTPPEGREQVPADIAVSGYTRKRRYIGSKDRRAITEMVWRSLRFRGVAEAATGQVISARHLLLATLIGALNWKTEDIEGAFDGSTYAPTALQAEDLAVLQAVSAAGEPPVSALANMPGWLAEEAALVLELSDREAWAALSAEAPVTLRVNTLKSDPAACTEALAAAGFEARATPLSPLGLTLKGRANLAQLPAMRDGWLDVQDEGSQIAAFLVDAQPGMRVLDYCAGGGGKALALAAFMKNDGVVVATDTDETRLKPLAARASRAGADKISSQSIKPGEVVDAGTFDRVLVDAPCSGSGAWRRRPEAPWRLEPSAYESLQALQEDILTTAAQSCRVGGRLVYVTCSVFPAENDAIIRSFLNRHPSFRRLDASHVWQSVLPAPPPDSVIEGDIIRLLPHNTATDGFFIAIMERITA